MEVILSTRNPNKAREIQTLFGDSKIRVRTLDEVGIEGNVVEDGTTLEENATKKAMFAHEHAKGSWVMSDDSGIFINAFDGEPGVNAAYWAGADVPGEVTMQYCIDRMNGLEDRSATFRAVGVVISPEGEPHVFEGEVEGTLLEAPRGQLEPKMPYSPLFVPNGQTRSWAEMNTEEVNATSHRGIAFKKVKEFLLTRV